MIHRILAPMVREPLHRGPDDWGISTVSCSGTTVGFGHTRLAILDLSEAGYQPMLDPSAGNWITYNGEIYNYRELRQELGDPPGGWRSNTDTEVILRAYAHWGIECVNHFRGMFAFALWDEQRQKLFLGVQLPVEITHRPKQGFTLPFDPWMRGKLKKYCEERLSPDRIRARGPDEA